MISTRNHVTIGLKAPPGAAAVEWRIDATQAVSGHDPCTFVTHR